MEIKQQILKVCIDVTFDLFIKQLKMMSLIWIVFSTSFLIFSLILSVGRWLYEFNNDLSDSFVHIHTGHTYPYLLAFLITNLIYRF